MAKQLRRTVPERSGKAKQVAGTVPERSGMVLFVNTACATKGVLPVKSGRNKVLKIRPACMPTNTNLTADSHEL